MFVAVKGWWKIFKIIFRRWFEGAGAKKKARRRRAWRLIIRGGAKDCLLPDDLGRLILYPVDEVDEAVGLWRKITFKVQLLFAQKRKVNFANVNAHLNLLAWARTDVIRLPYTLNHNSIS
jgi:hypothetical protein